MDATEVALADGQRALRKGLWSQARTCFEAVLRAGDTGAAREGLGLALWFLGDVPAAVLARQRAFELYAADRRPCDAARCAAWVAHQHALRGRVSASRGWLARAERVLDGAPECAGHGWVALERARHAAAGVDQARCAAEAVDVARRVHDADLEVLALSLLGRAEVAAGRRERGVALMEEAMAAAGSGAVINPHTVGEAYCNLVLACADTGDWARATEWCELVDHYAHDRGAAPLLGACRAVQGDVLLVTGDWPRAEEALETALATHARNVPAMGAPAVASLAELRVRQGRLADADRLLADRAETPAALRALALLRMAQARPREAVVLLERGLLGSGGDALRTHQLLASLVDARLAAGDLAAAEQAADLLGAGASACGLGVSAARADLARARVALARGRPDDAAEPTRRALAAFLALAMPVDAAEARLELARSIAVAAPEAAADEARVARAAFDQLGAAPASASAGALLTGLGTAVRLSPRELEVLELVARGLTNARIAATLVITEKTAGHHVSNILAKLGVSNRTEAAAHLAEARAARR